MTATSLSGKVALVTGAANGLGFEYAQYLAAQGAQVVVNDMGGPIEGGGSDAMAAEAAAATINDNGGRAYPNTGDVTNPDDVAAMIDQAFGLTGHLDVLICNAGIIRDRMLFNMPIEDWDAVIQVHLRGHFLPLHFAAKKWRSNSKAAEVKPASVILTTSRSGLLSNAGQLNYAAAKAGIASMAMVAARELERYSVRANAIAPMATTRMTKYNFGEAQGSRWTVANVSPMVGFLASDDSRDISGQVFVVGGGQVQWMEPWRVRRTLTLSEEPGVDEIKRRRDELFADAVTVPEEYPTAKWNE